MNILVVSQHFFPDNFRINEIVEELIKKGHQVTVITSTPDYATGYIPEEYKKKFEDDYKGAKILRAKTAERKTGVINRAKNYISFLLSSTKLVKKLKDDFDVIFSYQTSPVLMAHAAIKAKKLFNKKLVLYCLDIWPDSLKVWNINEKNIIFKLIHLYSKWVYRNADILAVSSKSFTEYMINFNNVDSKKIVYLPQHCFPLELDKNQFNDKKIFAFGGNIGAAQDIETIIKAVNNIKELDFSVEIYGDGSELSNCIALTEKLKLTDKIKFFGRVSKDELISKYNNVDAFLLTLKQNGEVGNTIPAKLQEYLSTGKPIFAAAGKGVQEIMLDADCGEACESSNYKKLSDLMKNFILNPDNYKQKGINGKNYYFNNFTIDKFIESLLKLFN